jgi:hypothetical protein
VTLGGQVASEKGKSQAESLAESLAGAQVVANQIAVIPLDVEKEAQAVNSGLDQGIEKNLGSRCRSRSNSFSRPLFERVCKMDLEGIVAKHSFGNYVTERERSRRTLMRVPSRSRQWPDPEKSTWQKSRLRWTRRAESAVLRSRRIWSGGWILSGWSVRNAARDSSRRQRNEKRKAQKDDPALQEKLTQCNCKVCLRLAL